ncbi:MAG TPA: hypothetical protein DEA75_21035, partial [Rhodobacteraceae bacterium]|nr:hypothetical protein [Paracoccaceae bacterium]
MSDVTNHADSFYVNTQQVNSQRWPDSVGLDNGNFAVTWVDFSKKEPNSALIDNASGGHPVVKVQLFNKYGTKLGDELSYDQAENYENNNHIGTESFYEPKVTALADGKYAIAYNYITNTTSEVEGNPGVYHEDVELRVRIFNADGTLDTSINYSTGTVRSLENLDLTTLNNGNIVVTFTKLDRDPTVTDSSLQQETGDDLNAVIFDQEGNEVVSPIILNQIDPSNVRPDSSGENYSSVTALKGEDGEDDGFIATWSVRPYSDQTKIMARIFDADGTPRADEFEVSDDTGKFHNQPNSTVLADGKIVVIWTATDGIFFQAYEADGTRIKLDVPGKSTSPSYENIYVPHPQKYADEEYKRDSSISEAMETPSIQALSNGNFVVAFSADKIPNPDGPGLLFGRHTVAYIYNKDFDIISDMIFLDRDTRENYPPDGIKGFPSISALKDGGFVVTWEDPKGDLGNEGSKTGNYEIEAAIYDAQGKIVKITGQDGTVQGTAAGDHMGVGHKDDQGDAITEGDDS